MSQQILIVGTNSVESLESSYARAFHKLGWKVTFWDPALILKNVVRSGRFGRLLNQFLHIEPWLRKANLALLQTVDTLKPDLVLVIATSGVRAGTLAQIKVRQPTVRLYCIYPDSPHNLDADRIHCLSFFDVVTTSSPAWVAAFQRLGAQRVYYLPFAADTELYQPTVAYSTGINFAHDLTFIGTWRHERETFLEQLADLDLCIWGSDYWRHRTRPNSPLHKRWGRRALVGTEFVQACQQSKIALNMMDPITWPGPNMRTFELPACRAFALTERTATVTEIFCEGKTIECFKTVEEAREKIKFYLTNETSRQRIADAAYHFVVNTGHTYIDRVHQICQWMQEHK